MSAPTLRERLSANLKALLDEDYRTRATISRCAWPDKDAVTADRHLRAIVARGWATPEDLDALASVLGEDQIELFRK